MNRFFYILFLLSLPLYSVSQKSHLPNTIVVKYKANESTKSNINTPPKVITNILKSNILEHNPMFPTHTYTKNETGLSRIFIVKTTEYENFLQDIYTLNKDARIEYAQPYYLPELLGEVNDPLVGGQYYLPIIQAFDAHNINTGDTNIVIGITDTGIDLIHPDLINSIKYNYNDPINGIDDDMDGFTDNFRGWDLGDNDNNPNRLISTHGTMVAGLAAATCNNEIGIYSIGYQTKILPIKIMDSRGYLSAAYQGIVYAADQGCQIINCSWGGQIPNPLCEDVIKYAIQEKNCLVVAAAGNSRTDQPFYPASCEGVLNVANTNRYDIKSSKSTYGVEVDICAPGEQVLTTYQSDKYHTGWGTSFASPIIAGSAALVLSQNPDFNGLQVGEQLRITADIIDTIPDNEYFYRHMGRGRVNAYNALFIDSLPSLRISDLKLIGENSTPLPGDTLDITFTITNYLYQVTNTIIQLSTNSEFVDPIKNIFSTGKLETLGFTDNLSSPLSISVSEDVPFDENIELDFKFAGEGHSDYQIFKTLINPSFINIEQAFIETSFTSNGKIGFANSQKILGKGIIYKKQVTLLPEAGIIIGNARDNIASALFDEYDFDIIRAIDTMTVDDSYIIGKSSYKSGDKYSKLPLKINQESKIYLNDELNSVIFHAYKIVNEGDVELKDITFSIFTNWDIDNYLANRVEYVESQNLFYTKTNTSKNTIAGVALISENSCIPYAFDLVEGGNGGLDITTDFKDNQKWFAMNSPRYNDNNTADTINVASMISSPQYNIKANDTLEIAICFVIADSYYDLLEKTRLAREIYLKTNISSREKSEKAFSCYPNPANDVINLNFHSSALSRRIYIINNDGKVLLDKSINGSNYQQNISTFKNGVYFIQVQEDSKISTQKIIILR